MKHLFLLHGAIGSATQLQGLATELAPFFIIHAPDLPGHGEAVSEKAFSIPRFSEDIIDYCDKNGIQKAHFFGYSMGGYVAMYLARHRPELVDRLITLATKFHWDEGVAAREVKMLDPEVIAEKLPQFAAELEKRHHAAGWKAVLGQTAAMLSEMGKDNPLKQEDYGQISHPCLVMLGDRDKMVGLEETAAVFRALPAGQLAVLPGTPHPLERVHAGRLSNAIRTFLESVTA